MILFRSDTVTGEDMPFSGRDADTGITDTDGAALSLPEMAGVRSAYAPNAARDRTVPISDLGSDALRLNLPLHVVVSESDGLVTAMSYDLELIEEGETDFEALDALRAAIVELYGTLRDEATLPRHLQSKLDFLESMRR